MGTCTCTCISKRNIDHRKNIDQLSQMLMTLRFMTICYSDFIILGSQAPTDAPPEPGILLQLQRRVGHSHVTTETQPEQTQLGSAQSKENVYYDNDNYDLMSYIEVSSSIYCIAVFTMHMALVSFDPQNRPSNSPTF